MSPHYEISEFYRQLRTNIRIEKDRIATRLIVAGPAESSDLRAAEAHCCAMLLQLSDAERQAHLAVPTEQAAA